MKPKLVIAAGLLGNLISNDRGKCLESRLYDVHHSLALAELLIQNCSDQEPAELNLELHPAPTNPHEAQVSESPQPQTLRPRIESRRGEDLPPHPFRPRPGPTLH